MPGEGYAVVVYACQPLTRRQDGRHSTGQRAPPEEFHRPLFSVQLILGSSHSIASHGPGTAQPRPGTAQPQPSALSSGPWNPAAHLPEGCWEHFEGAGSRAGWGQQPGWFPAALASLQGARLTAARHCLGEDHWEKTSLGASAQPPGLLPWVLIRLSASGAGREMGCYLLC